MKSPALLLLFIVAFWHAPAAQALEITVQPNGEMTISAGQVLGDSTERGRTAPTTLVRSQAKQTLQVTPSQAAVEVELVSEAERKNLQEETRTKSAGSSAEPVRVKFPAGRTEAQQKEAARREAARVSVEAQTIRDEAQTIRDQAQEMRAVQVEEARALREEAQVQRDTLQATAAALRAEHREYRAALHAERQERVQELVELRNSLQAEGKPALELQSRNVRAKLNGASFTLDPQTNTVTLTTPSGNTHELNHLPDQAINRMNELGFFEQTSPEGGLEITPTEEGLVYKTRTTQKKKLLGLFERRVPTEVTLNDTTGEVEQTEVQTDSLWSRTLNNLSF